MAKACIYFVSRVCETLLASVKKKPQKDMKRDDNCVLVDFVFIAFKVPYGYWLTVKSVIANRRI